MVRTCVCLGEDVYDLQFNGMVETLSGGAQMALANGTAC